MMQRMDYMERGGILLGHGRVGRNEGRGSQLRSVEERRLVPQGEDGREDETTGGDEEGEKKGGMPRTERFRRVGMRREAVAARSGMS